MPAEPLDAAPALRAAARLGPYFAWEPWDGGPGWRPLAEWTDADVLAERVAAAHGVLARMAGVGVDDIAERVVASTVFLGLAARLLAPLLAAATVGGALPVPDPRRLWWRPVGGGPVPVAHRGLRAVDAGRDPATVAATLTRTATVGLVEPVLEVVRRRFVVSPPVLWGNVASALGGAAGMIADAVPARAGFGAEVVARALALPPLRGTATLVHPDPARERRFLLRRNCCLYYRIPGGGTCGDCVLTPVRAANRRPAG